MEIGNTGVNVLKHVDRALGSETNTVRLRIEFTTNLEEIHAIPPSLNKLKIVERKIVCHIKNRVNSNEMSG